MTGYLIDTNVVSELTKRRPHPAVVTWFENVDDERVFLSVLTVGELRSGIARLSAADPRVDALSGWVDGLVAQFSDRILAVDLSVVDVWGRISAARTLPAVDGLLAATAIAHDLILVTRNGRDVEGVPVRTYDPFA